MGIWRFVCAGAALAAACGGAFAAGDLAGGLFGAAAGKGKAFACFTRTYDPAHLSAHPKQNVTTMTLLASRDPADAPGAVSAGILVTFRSVKGALVTGGGCRVEGAAAHCDVACEGGVIDVTLEAAGTALVQIPQGARLYDPTRPDEEFGSAKGKFGPDDKVFRLARTRPADCLPLASDDDRAALREAPH